MTKAQPAIGLGRDDMPAKLDGGGLPTIAPSDVLAMDGYGGEGNTPPTTSGIPDVYVDEDAADVVISLYDAFDDAEDSDWDLTYEEIGNTNPYLFNAVYVDGQGGLVLDFAADAFGESVLTIRATDPYGMYVETSFTVHVAPVNDPPVIVYFGAVQGWGDLWTFSGGLFDVDDFGEVMIVHFGGVLEGYNLTASVQAGSTFSVTALLPGLQSGTVTAQTQDDGGLYSNVAWYEITV